MNGDERKPVTFSWTRRWGAMLNLLITVAAVLAIVAMVNYLGIRWYARVNLTRSADTELTKRTRHVLATLTNTVKVITYFDSHEDLFPRVRALLKEYENASGNKIVVQHVDYLRDPALANSIRMDYKLQQGANKDLIIFSSGNRRKIVHASELSDYDYSKLVSGESKEIVRTHFKGEVLFTSAIYSVTSVRSPKAYFLIGHGEHSPSDTVPQQGYAEFASMLQHENNIDLQLLDLVAQKEVPPDCSVLIISGPQQTVAEDEVERIQRYLERGGRLLVTFNVAALSRPTGFEQLFASWGIEIGQNIVLDPEHSSSPTGADPLPINPGTHAIVTSLGESRVRLFRPRSMRALRKSTAREDAKVEEILFTGPKTVVITGIGGRTRPEQKATGPQPLGVVVEKSIPSLQSGSTRIVAIGDSMCWANQIISVEANRVLAAAAVNWLVQQDILLSEIPRRAIRNYKLTMTHSQLSTSRILLLAAMPGAVLLVGFLVWARRRK